MDELERRLTALADALPGDVPPVAHLEARARRLRWRRRAGWVAGAAATVAAGAAIVLAARPVPVPEIGPVAPGGAVTPPLTAEPIPPSPRESTPSPTATSPTPPSPPPPITVDPATVEWMTEEQRQAWEAEHGPATWIAVAFWDPALAPDAPPDPPPLPVRWARIADEAYDLPRDEQLRVALLLMTGPGPADLHNAWRDRPESNPDLRRVLQLSSVRLDGDRLVLDFEAIESSGSGSYGALLMAHQFEETVRLYYPEAARICVLLHGQPTFWLHDMESCPA